MLPDGTIIWSSPAGERVVTPDQPPPTHQTWKAGALRRIRRLRRHL